MPFQVHLRCVARPFAICVTALVVLSIVPPVPAGAATSSTVVGATVPSATSLNIGGCATGSASTSLGSVAVGTSVVTATDCVVVFGSSNDTASLRLFQSDGTSTAMARFGWQAQASGYGSVLYDVQAVSPTQAWAVGWNGTIRTTSNGGATWTGQTSPQTSDTWRSIAATSATDLHVVGAAGRVAISTNGTTWSAQASPTTNDLHGVEFRDSQNGLAVGASGTAIVTANGGATWAATGATGTAGSIWGVTHVSASTWVMAGSSSAIRRTTNDGGAWANIAAPVAGITLRAVDALGSEVWIVGDGGNVFRSTDSGATFGAVTSGTTTALYGVKLLGPGHVVVTGNNGVMRRSTDGGATWTDDRSGTTTWLQAIDGFGPEDLWAVGETGAIRSYDLLASVPDFASVTNDWGTSGSLFGACLRTVTNGAATSGVTWPADSDTIGDEAAASADCGDGNGDPWNPIVDAGATAGSIVARTVAPQDPASAEARLRFGMRAAPGLAPGSYYAAVTFDVIAPAL